MGKLDQTVDLSELGITPSQEPMDDSRKAVFIIIAGPNIGQVFTLETNQVVIGRDDSVDITIPHEAISRKHAKVVRFNDFTFALVDLDSTNGTYCNGEKISEKFLNDGDRIMIGTTTILKFSYQGSLEKEFQEHLFHSAVKDGLTNCFNKKYFEEQLEIEFKFCVRHDKPLSLIIFDIDHFKKINDTYGHICGDQILKEIAEIVQNLVRTEDILARFGGEEFAVIMRQTDNSSAYIIAERLRKEIEKNVFTYKGQDISVTISLGIASYFNNSPNNPEQLIALADKHLYTAKQNGRNRTESIATST